VLAFFICPSVLGPFLERLKLSDSGAYVDCTGFTKQPIMFWKQALKRVCHG